MKKRHFNGLMLVFSVIGGIIGYIIGEVLLNAFRYKIPDIIIVGMYFSIFSLCVTFMCLLAELIKPRLTNSNWVKIHLKTCFAIILPLTVIAMFAVGCVTQFIYGLDIPKQVSVPADDYIFLMDNSGSMGSSDPDDMRIQAIDELVEQLDESKRTAYYSFSSESVCQVPFSTVNNQTKQLLHTSIYNTQSDGGTDIKNALSIALDDIENKLDPNRKTALVLISDGEDFFDTKEIVSRCNNKNIKIDTIGLGLSMFSSGQLMGELADMTNGNYYDIQSADQIFGILDKVKQGKTNSRILLDRRYGEKRDSVLCGIERTVFISSFGVLLGLAIGMLFDNRQLMKNLLVGGAVTGLLAGLLMEIGMYFYLNTRFCRCGMDILLALVMCMFTMIIPYEINRVTSYSKIGNDNQTDYVSIKNGIDERFGTNDNNTNNDHNQFI